MKAVDAFQERLARYALGLRYEDLPTEVVHAVKARIVDTFGALVGGFFGDPCRVLRDVAAGMGGGTGATIIGTRRMTTPDMAALINGTAARYAETNDTYHWPGSRSGHGSDAVMPVLAAAESAHVGGKEFIVGTVMAYEIFLRLADSFRNRGIDESSFTGLATAMAAGRFFGLSHGQMAECIAMAVVPNVILSQVRSDHLTMYKAVAAGHAGKAGVFAAMLARAGMEGPHLPFEGKHGWFEHAARGKVEFEGLGGEDAEFKIGTTLIKPRASCGTAISSVLATEKISPVGNIGEIERVVVEVYKKAKDGHGTDPHQWNPESRETADHSIPYVVAATLMDGTITPRQFNDSHLWSPALRALMRKVEVEENPEFTRAYDQLPLVHRTRVTVTTGSGQTLVGETGQDGDEMNVEWSDKDIADKFRLLTGDVLGGRQADGILDRLWHLDEIADVVEIPPRFVFD